MAWPVVSLASPGYQRSKVDRSVPSSVLVRVCKRRCAPRRVHCICCFLSKPFAHHGVDRRLDESRGNTLAGSIPFAVIDETGRVRGNIGGELTSGSEKFAQIRIARFETEEVDLKVLDHFLGAGRVSMPEFPFNSLKLLCQSSAGFLVVLRDTFCKLAEHGDAHGDMEPVENMFAARANPFGERPDFLAAVGQESDVLIGLHPLAFQHIEKAALRLPIEAVDEAEIAGGAVLRHRTSDDDLEIALPLGVSTARTAGCASRLRGRRR